MTRRKAALWGALPIGFAARVAIAKTVLQPSVWFFAEVSVLSKSILQQIDAAITRFIWQGGGHRVNKETLHKPIHLGGVGLLPIGNLLEERSW